MNFDWWRGSLMYSDSSMCGEHHFECQVTPTEIASDNFSDWNFKLNSFLLSFINFMVFFLF